MTHFHVNKTVSRSFVSDFIARVQNIFGWNLKSYEKMVDKAISQIKEELNEKKITWFRYEITQLTSGALSVTMYGELE